jgi:hypothetical protein
VFVFAIFSGLSHVHVCGYFYFGLSVSNKRCLNFTLFPIPVNNLADNCRFHCPYGEISYVFSPLSSCLYYSIT